MDLNSVYVVNQYINILQNDDIESDKNKEDNMEKCDVEEDIKSYIAFLKNKFSEEKEKKLFAYLEKIDLIRNIKFIIIGNYLILIL